MASMEKFTQRARRVLSLAHQEAERAHKGMIGTEHLLLGLLEEDGGVAGRVLRELGLESGRVREMVQRIIGEGHYEGGKIELAPDTQEVLEYAIEEARKMGHHYIGTEHLLLGLVRSEGTAMEVLKKLGVTAEQVRRQTRRVLQESTGSQPSPVPEAAKLGGQTGTQDPAGGPARHRPDHPGRRRQTGPGDRPPDGDRTRDPDPGPPDEKQPGPDRRTGGRQDRHRRGTGPAHHRRGCAGAAA